MERNYSIDTIKCFAIFSVVILHTVTGGYLGFLVTTLSKFAVPFFFMASGFLLGEKIRLSKNQFHTLFSYIKKISKIYLKWFLFYFLLDLSIMVAYHFVKDSSPVPEMIKYVKKLSLLNVFYYGDATSGYQLWFLPSLIISIILVYFSHKYNMSIAILIFSLVLNIIGLFGQSYSFLIDLNINTRDPLFFGLFYTCLGFFFSCKHNLFIKKYSRGNLYLFLVVIFALLQVMERYILTKVYSGQYGDYFISTIFLSFFLFLFVVNNTQLGKYSFFVKIGRNSLGIYVIHIAFIKIINTALAVIEINIFTNALTEIIYAFFIFTISYLFYNLLQKSKLKLLNKINQLQSFSVKHLKL
ncbi:acyltransferase [Neobacillus vireti]